MANVTFCLTRTDCGDHGDCISGSCSCDPLWAKTADWVEFEDCSQSAIAMYILWGVNLALCIWVVYKTAWVILFRFENFFEQRRQKHNYTLWHNKGLIGVIFYFGFSLPFQVAMCIYHFVYPFGAIGFDAFPTAMFFLAKFGFYVTVVFTQGPMLGVVLRGEPSKARLVRMGYISNSISSSLAILLGALPFVTITLYQDDIFRQFVIMQAYYFIQAFVTLVNGLFSLFLLKKINQALDKAAHLISNEEKKSDNIRAKIHDLQMSSAKTGIIQAGMYFFMGVIPFFYTKHNYFLPISWLVFPLLGKKLAFQITLDKKGAKSIMQRLGIQKTSTFNEATGNTNNAVVGADGNTRNPSSMTQIPGSTKILNQIKSRNNNSSAISETTAMEDLLSKENPNYKAFRDFVNERHATSELNLLEQCIAYKHATTDKQRRKLGQAIMKRFIVDGAPEQVDIPHGVKRMLEACAEKKEFIIGTFDAVRGPLIFDVRGNFFSQFEKKQSAVDVMILKKDTRVIDGSELAASNSEGGTQVVSSHAILPAEETNKH